MYIVPIIRQNFDYATPISCDNIPQNVIAMEPDNDEHRVLTHKPIRRTIPLLFEPKQVQSAMSPITSIAHNAGISFNAELTTFWTNSLYTKQPDTKLKFLGKSFLD